MDTSCQISTSSPASLSAVSPGRVNSQRGPKIYHEPNESSGSIYRGEKSVHEKVMAFNTLSYQTRKLDSKTSDAALKRAILGREEAESDLRRYKDETFKLRNAVTESKRRELVVGERLESLMDNFSRANQNFERSKLAWEKEMRRARKEKFKTQSSLLTIQEELKSSRMAVRAAKSDLNSEKSRSIAREQEAFQARLQLVQVQGELAQAREQLKNAQQERDILRSVVEKEDIARIAAEGLIPLPISTHDDEFASPKKTLLNTLPVTIQRSAASEEELEELRMQLSWEEQRARRAFDRIEFIEVERLLHCCISPAASQIHNTLSSQDVIPETNPAFVETSVDANSSSVYSSQSVADNKNIKPCVETLAPGPKNIVLGTLLPLDNITEEPQSDSATTTQQSDSKKIANETLQSQTKVKIVSNPITSPCIEKTKPPDTKPLLPSKDAFPEFALTISRTAALAQIQERRGRARSMAQGNLTPGKHLIESIGARRNISAPAIRTITDIRALS